MILKSQQVRSLSPEMDPLRMGMGWTVDDLSKPQIMVESTYGNSHPGSGHLNIFVEEAVRGGDCRHPSDGRWLSACPDGVSAGAVKSGFSSSVENSSSSRCARRMQRSVPSA